jgi:uncharacterized membrane-anchored protein
MAALLGLPAARQVARWLDRGEAELAALAQAIGSAAPADEPALLDRLTRLAAELESLYAATTRFSASAAYDELVRQRMNDMAEVRIEGMQRCATSWIAATRRPWPPAARPTGARPRCRRASPAWATCCAPAWRSSSSKAAASCWRP